MINARVCTISFLTLVSAAGGGCKTRAEQTAPLAATASPDRVPAGVTVVQNEMRLLQEALRNSVTAIAMGTLETVPESLHSVHRARELTERAVESGAYKLPKNGDRLAEFEELDGSFHVELEKLASAAQSKNSQATATQLGVVLSKCDGCHSQYRR
ncbi:MAG: cytochrome c [Polyangiaceae bacterium]